MTSLYFNYSIILFRMVFTMIGLYGNVTSHEFVRSKILVIACEIESTNASVAPLVAPLDARLQKLITRWEGGQAIMFSLVHWIRSMDYAVIMEPRTKDCNLDDHSHNKLRNRNADCDPSISSQPIQFLLSWHIILHLPAFGCSATQPTVF